jgi:hypothetical protein
MHRAGHGGEDLAVVMFDIDRSSASTKSTATGPGTIELGGSGRFRSEWA